MSTKAQARALRDHIDIINAKAKTAWTEFSRARDALGTAPDADALAQVEALGKAYDQIRDEYASADAEWKQVMARLSGIDSGPGTGPDVRDWGKSTARSLHTAIKANPYGGRIVVPAPRPVEQPDWTTVRSIYEALPRVPESHIYEYDRWSAGTNNAAPVSEGGTKPTTDPGVSRVEGRTEVVAHLAPISDLMLADLDGMEDTLVNVMHRGLVRAIDGLIVSGNGTTPSPLGLLNVAGLLTQARGSASRVDTVIAGMGLIENGDGQPFLIAAGNTVTQTILTEKDANGQYFMAGSGNGSPVDRADRRIWGVPIINTPGVPATHGVVIGADALRIADSSDGIAVEWSRNSDDFARNKTTLRVETRIGLQVRRPHWCVDLTGM